MRLTFEVLTWVGTTRNLRTPILKVLENICICLELQVIISYHLCCLTVVYIIFSSYYLCFCIPSIIQQLYAICHINEKATP